MRQKAGALRQAVELVVLLAGGEGAAGHVEVGDVCRTSLQGSDGEGAGVGEQVEDLGAAPFHLLEFGRELAHPAAAFGHVEEKTVVLPAQHVHQKTRGAFGDDVRVGHAAGHQARVGTRAGAGWAALLKDPVEVFLLASRCDVPPAGLQRGADGRELVFGRRREAGEDEDGRIRVERPLLAAGIQPAPPVEDAARVDRQRHGGDGVEQGLHGQDFGVFGLRRLMVKREQLFLV